MKQTQTKNKIIYILITAILIVGIIAINMNGFKFDTQYQTSNMIQIHIGDTFNIQDIRNMTNEIMGNNKVSIQKVEMFEDTVQIKSATITETQKSDIIKKINEKYGKEIKTETITIESIPHTHLRDILKPYVIPVIVATVLILIYIMIRYRKLGIISTMAKTIAIIVVLQLVLFSLMAIVEIPIGKFTIPLVLFVYFVSMLGITIKFENELKQIKDNDVEKEDE